MVPYVILLRFPFCKLSNLAFREVSSFYGGCAFHNWMVFLIVVKFTFFFFSFFCFCSSLAQANRCILEINLRACQDLSGIKNLPGSTFFFHKISCGAFVSNNVYSIQLQTSWK